MATCGSEILAIAAFVYCRCGDPTELTHIPLTSEGGNPLVSGLMGPVRKR